MPDANPDEPSVLVVSRPRGRPRVAERGTPLTTWVKEGEYDRIVKIATERGQSVSSVARESLVRDLLKMTRQK